MNNYYANSSCERPGRRNERRRARTHVGKRVVSQGAEYLRYRTKNMSCGLKNKNYPFER